MYDCVAPLVTTPDRSGLSVRSVTVLAATVAAVPDKSGLLLSVDPELVVAPETSK